MVPDLREVGKRARPVPLPVPPVQPFELPAGEVRALKAVTDAPLPDPGTPFF